MNFKIATLNFWGLPFPLSKDKKQRFQKLLEIIKKEEFDVLALQELWMNHDVERLKAKFPNYFFYNRKGFIFNPSGLVLMSKFELFDKKYIPLNSVKLNFKSIWKKLTLKESFFEKGLLQASVQLGQQKIRITNLHLHYCVDSKLCSLQYSKAISLLKEKNNILLGDFNIDLPNLVLPKGYKLLSNSKGTTLEKTNPYCSTFFNKFHLEKGSPDLIISNLACRVLKNKTDNKNIISDHYLVSSEIEI